jgi:hypothetical protein
MSVFIKFNNIMKLKVFSKNKFNFTLTALYTYSTDFDSSNRTTHVCISARDCACMRTLIFTFLSLP